MIKQADLPLHGIAVYNPDLLSKEELAAIFVARKPLLQRLLEDLGHQGATQHHLLVGQRGMGKTTLLRRLRDVVEDDPILSQRWLPLTFPEEQNNVSKLSELYLNCVDALCDSLDRLGYAEQVRALDQAVAALLDREEPARAKSALEILVAGADRVGRRLLLLIDNIDQILDRLKDDQWAIRELLSSEPRLLLIGASTVMIESTYRYDAPFYDFFQIHELGGLTEEESREVLLTLAQVCNASSVERVLREDVARLRALHVLAGGNPRTIVLIYNVLATGTEGDVRSDLERLLDLCTPLYKARFEELPPQSQQVVDALAIHWDPISAAELADRLNMDVNTVSSQLNRLVKQGVVEKVAYHPSSKIGFQVAERFFNIWYLMRASRRIRQRLIWLVECLKLLFGHEGLQKHARNFLRSSRGLNSHSPLRHAEYGLALAQAIGKTSIRRALEHTALHALMADQDLRLKLAAVVDLDESSGSLKSLAERQRAVVQIEEAIASAKVRWRKWDPKRFGDLLGGSSMFSLAEKRRIAGKLAELSSKEIRELADSLEKERRNAYEVVRCEATIGQIWEALRRGYMLNTRDVVGAEAAAEALDAPGLPAIALALRMSGQSLEKSSSKQINKLKAAVSGTTSPYPWSVLGALCALHNRFFDAEWAYRKAIEFDPTFASAWDALGEVLSHHADRYDEAEAAYRKAIDLNPKEAFYRMNLGSLLHHDLRRYQEAYVVYLKAIELDPADAWVWDSLGDLLHDHLSKPAEAEAAYRKAIELSPTKSWHWHSLANFLENHAGEYAQAEVAYRRAIDLNPTESWHWVRLGGLLQDHMERDGEAEAAYRKAIELAPAQCWHWYSLARLLTYRMERHAEAEAAYRKAIELDPNDGFVLSSMAWFLYLSDRRDDETEAIARRALALEPEDEDALHTLATILAFRGKWSEAQLMMHRLLSEAPPKDQDWLWDGALLFFQEAVRTGHAADSVALLEELGMAGRWRPLREALAAIAAGTKDYLRRIAPEIRRPAQQIIQELLPEGLD